VVGSMNLPETLDENILKPYKFLNQITVYQPYDAKQRREVIDYYVDKNNYQIAGETNADKEKILKGISESTMGFTVVDLIYLLENAQIISKERDKNAIDSSDLIESLLQIYSGRTNTFETTDVTKQITTAHEAGHALTSLIMYNLMSTNPWNMPYKMDYMTLDSRGNYGGMVSFKDSENIEESFERVISEIVVDYGGYSSENHFYGMRGSMGIRQDMKNAESHATKAVKEMGMGYRIGVRRISDLSYLSERQKENFALDVEDILKTARKISDLIVKEHSDFIEQFTKKYYSRVSTGECIISAEEFQKELENWRKEDPAREYGAKILEDEINKLIEDCKNGKVE